ncbi:MAG: flavin reductase family protein [Syntrophorhabdales bacterium]|jgi:flavin reductase (DIM6/NTAB) family NADH-FMN oxidoreductase RutF
MAKIEVTTEKICYPMPCCLVGANVAGKPTFLTVAWFGMVNPKPPYMMLSLGPGHYSNPGIRQNGTFSVNIPSASMVEATDYCGIVSGKKYDKSKVFEVFYGKLKTAPMIAECPYNLECRLVKTVELPTDEMFIGEIVAAYSEERFMTGGVPDLAKMSPFVLSMADSRYIGLGAEVGKAWAAGKKLIGKG